MELVIKTKDVKSYELTKVEVKTSKDGNTRYAVCEFKQAGLSKLLQEQASGVTMQLMAAYGSTKEHENAYFKLIEESIGEKMLICRVEVTGFPDFIRKDNDGKIITETKERDGKQVKVASIYNSVFIYTLCNDEGECIKSDASLIKRGESLYNNSQRIVDYVEYDTKRKAAKAAKEAAKAAEAAEAAEEKKSNPLLEGEIVDDDEL
jgi:predicted RecB family nuclease